MLGEEFEEDNTLVLQDEDGWYDEIDIFDKNNQKFAYYSHTPDYDGEWNDIYEYKIEWNSIFKRVLEKKITHPWEEYYDVKDWVILESEVIERWKENIFLHSDELIIELKNEILWNEIKNIEMKYFIISKSPEKISVQEFKTILRTELERVNLLLLKFKEICSKYKVEYEYNERDYIEIKLPELKNNVKAEWFLKELELLEESNNCSRNDIFSSSERIKTIDWYLENLK